MAFLRHVSGLEGGAVLRGPGVMLRLPHSSDYQEWAALRLESRPNLEPVEPLWADDELSRGAFRRRLAHYARDVRDGTGLAVLIFKDGGPLLGGITLSNIRRGVSQTGSVGYWLGTRHWRHGHMSAALGTFVTYCFEELRLHRIEAACLPTNVASIRVLERTQFRHEGLARSYLKIAGQWQDHLTFGLVADDWRQSCERAGASSRRAEGVG
ncbi:MAG TPA: GNAT family protein [Hyphomicrobiaceae bacterium]|nr:GNAT family protein [Hyphomicrobiaceae bacterium]